MVGAKVIESRSVPAGSDERLPIQVARDAGGDHVALPSFAKPRLIVPVRLGRRASYGHLESGRSLKSTAFLVGTRVGAIRGDPVRIAGVEALMGSVSDVLGRPVTLALRIGTPGAHQKVVALVFDESSRPIAFVKIASSRHAVARVRHEAEVLTRLGASGVLSDSVPRVLGLAIGRRATVLVLSLAPARPGPRTWGRAHDYYVEELYRATGRVGSLESSQLWRSAVQAFEHLEGWLTAKWAARLGAALESLDRGGSSERILSTAHRDLTPWNTRSHSQGRIHVFDWEFAAEDYPTGLDKLHFHASLAALSATGRARSTWERLVLSTDSELVTAYLVDASLFYLRARYEAPDVGEDTFLDWFGTELDRALRG